HTAKLLSTTNAGAREPVPGTSSFVKDSAREGWERWFAVSWVDPTRRTPVLMMHGDEDPLIHPSSTGLAYDLLQHLGYPVKMVTFSGVNHVWNANTEAGSSPERVLRSQEIFQFLGRNLGWKGKRPSDPCAAPPQVSMSQVAADTLAAVANETLTDAERQYIEDDLATLAASGPVSPPRHCEAAL
ncbi:MAG TPA: prolyl oligopeptidase family serine peptidase, partial [Polyangiales bacterium]